MYDNYNYMYNCSYKLTLQVFHYITLHYITLHYITLHYITLHYITPHYIHYITLPYLTLPYITLHYITLHYITLHVITLHYHAYIHIYVDVHTYIIHTTYMHACIHTLIGSTSQGKIPWVSRWGFSYCSSVFWNGVLVVGLLGVTARCTGL